MTLEQAEQFKLDYIDGKLSDTDLKQLLQYMESEHQSIAELDQLKTMMQQLENQTIPSSSAELDNRINHLISSKETPRPAFFQKRYLLIAVYTIVILGAGIAFGFVFQSSETDKLTAEMRELRQLVLQTMNEKEASAGNRIQAISLSSRLNDLDKTIIDVLLHTFNTDPNVNVRLSSLEVLSSYSNNDYVRSGLVKSIVQQKSALLQIALLNIMIDWQEKTSIQQFVSLLKNPDMDMIVVRQIEQGLEKI